MSQERTISVGVAGTSWWADAMYMPAIANHPNAVVTAVCGRNEERAATMAERWDVPNYYTDYDEMINSGTINAVIIATVNKEHYGMTMKALDAGLHVLCEKPLAMTYAEAVEMVNKAEESGLKTMVPFTYRFMPAARYLKQLINEGYIGKPYHMNMRYYTGFARDGEYLWRFDLAEAGSGVIGDLGAHWLYLAQWYFGDIESVMCQFSYHVERAPRPDGTDYERADDSASVLVRFKNGAQAVLVVSAVCYEDTPFGQTHHMEFHGSDGTLYYFCDWDTVQEVKGAKVGDGAPKLLPIPEEVWGKSRRNTVHNTYRDMFRENDFMARGLITAIIEDTDPEPTFKRAAYVQRVLEACQLSAKEDRRVMIDEIRA